MSCKSSKRGVKPKKSLVVIAVAAIACIAVVGCDEVQKTKIKNAAHQAILSYVETKGQEEALKYIDKLEAEGNLGAANAERLRKAVPQGVDKLKEVMGEVEAENTSEVQE